MNADIAASESILHRGSSGLFVEGSRLQQVPLKKYNVTWPAIAVKARLRSKVEEQPRKALNVDRQNPDGNAALHFAAFEGELGKARLLIAVGADVNIRNGRGDTPLICAAYNDHCDVIMALIAAGAEIDAHDEDGRTALTWAVIRGQTDVVRLLISLGADLSICDNIDNTPLLWSVIHNQREICEILIEAEDRLNIR